MSNEIKEMGLGYEEFLQANDKKAKHKIVEFTVAGKVFPVKIKTEAGLEDKTKIVQVALGLLEDAPDLAKEVLAEYALLVAILKTLTNIGFPKEEDTLNRFLAALIENEIPQTILAEIGAKTMEDIATFLEDFNLSLPGLVGNLTTKEE